MPKASRRSPHQSVPDAFSVEGAAARGANMETRTARGTQHVAHHAGYSYKPLLAAGEPFRSRKSEREIQAEKKSLHLCPFFPANLRCLRPKPDVQSVAHITERKIGAKPVNAPKSAAQVVVIVAAFRNFLAKPPLVGIFSEHRSTATQLFLRTLLIWVLASVTP